MISVIFPEDQTRIKQLENLVEYFQKRSRERLRERDRFIELFKDWADMAELPDTHEVSRILKAEYDDDPDTYDFIR